jgi:predicted secreted protein
MLGPFSHYKPELLTQAETPLKLLRALWTKTLFLYQNVSVLIDQKIYIASEPARSDTRIYKKGTNSLSELYNNHQRNKSYKQIMVMRGTKY